MNFNKDHVLIIAYSISNIVSLLFLWAAIKKPKLARLLFVMLFAWASWTNYNASQQRPEIYLDYTQYAVGIYKQFINGWFKGYIREMVGLIAFGQAIIALGMLLKGTWVNLACIGAIVFLMSIAPLGIGAGFPFSLTVSIAAYIIMRKDDKRYLWQWNDGKTYLL